MKPKRGEEDDCIDDLIENDDVLLYTMDLIHEELAKMHLPSGDAEEPLDN